MKISISKLTVINSLIIICLAFLCSCGDEDNKFSKQDEVRALLMSGPWTLTKAEVEGADRTDLYKDLSITFTKDKFSTSNGEPIWQVSGLWDFQSETASAIVRGDNLVIDLNTITKDLLVMHFMWNETTFGGGRTNSIKGDHVLTFSH